MKQLISTLTLFLTTSGLLLSNLSASESPELRLAKAHGLEEWEQVETLEFTFYVNRNPPVSRHWQWNVKDKLVTRTIDEKTVTIQLEALAEKADAEVHKQFINDSFWLLFPFSVVWSSPAVTVHGTEKIEIEGKTVGSQKLTATWPQDEGYTPGDAYDLYLSADDTILAWNFRKGNAPQGKFFTWKDPVELGPIKVYKSYYTGGRETPLIEMRDLKVKLLDQ